MDKLSFEEAINMAHDIVKRFEKIEGKPWGVEGSMIELSKQVGELSKQVMIQEGYYPKNRNDDHPGYESSKEIIADELADILFMVIRIADHYKIDLEEAHTRALDDANNYLLSKSK